MFFKLIEIIRSFFMFTGSYSNNVFYDPLSSEEEEKYINLLLEKNQEARNKLIEHNLRLVAHITKKYDYKFIIRGSFDLLLKKVKEVINR